MANALQKLQNAEHHIKMRWLIALSIAAMAIIVWVWLAAFPGLVAISPAATEANPNPKPQLSGAASLLQSFNQ